MARVNVEQQALVDGRMRYLGKLIGTDQFGALGRMVYVWNACQEQSTYTLSFEELEGITDVENFGQHLIAARLGRKQGKKVYICGSQGRIEWLEKKRRVGRENGKLGGRPRAKSETNDAKNETDEEPKENLHRFTVETPPAPALSLAPTETKREREISTNAREGSKGDRGERRGMTEGKFLYLAGEIRQWRDANPAIGPGEEEFDLRFEDRFGFGYDYWLEQQRRFNQLHREAL